MLEQKGKILSTLESTKQQTSRIVTIFFPLVSFLNVSTNYLTFKISNACTCQDISTTSKSAPLEARQVSLSKFCYSFRFLSLPKGMKALQRKSIERMCKHIKLILLHLGLPN